MNIIQKNSQVIFVTSYKNLYFAQIDTLKYVNPVYFRTNRSIIIIVQYVLKVNTITEIL